MTTLKASTTRRHAPAKSHPYPYFGYNYFADAIGQLNFCEDTYKTTLYTTASPVFRDPPVTFAPFPCEGNNLSTIKFFIRRNEQKGDADR